MFRKNFEEQFYEGLFGREKLFMYQIVPGIYTVVLPKTIVHLLVDYLYSIRSNNFDSTRLVGVQNENYQKPS